MKALTKTTALIATLTIMLSTNLFGSAFSFNEESYIDDIPFNTEEIFNEIVVEMQLADFNFEVEAYINDIPFDTEVVTLNNKYEQAISVEFQLEDEEYIDDITYDTECITANCLYQKAMQVEFNFEEEQTINDIEL